MGSRHWTDEELEYLENKLGVLSTEAIAKKLGRSRSAIALKQHRMGYGGFLQNTDKLNRYNVCSILGIEYKSVANLEKNGLKFFKRGGYYVISQEDLLEFLKNNQNLWNSARVTDDSIFANEDWYIKKKESDKGRKKSRSSVFSPEEVSKMKYLYYTKAYSVKQVANKLGRSYCSIRSKLYTERKKRR